MISNRGLQFTRNPQYAPNNNNKQQEDHTQDGAPDLHRDTVLCILLLIPGIGHIYRPGITNTPHAVCIACVYSAI
jgi:hypothetical protein